MLIVAPKGIEKDDIDLSTPKSLLTVFKVNGIEALLLDVLNVKIIRDLSLV
tara:strand:- start:114 stop:266 length:153 start_codon:yes stop_codon:yes gene_type:complete